MEVHIPAKIIRANGATQSVTITNLSDEGVGLDGIDELSIGERVLLLLPDTRVHEIAVRWAVGGQAGARFVD